MSKAIVASVSIEEYRKITNDYKTSDEKVLQKLFYLEALCKNIIRNELENFYTKGN